MMRWLLAIFLWATTLSLWAGAIYPCGLESTFRAYLDKRFWQPLSKYEESLGVLHREESSKQSLPFAGMSTAESGEVLQEAREAYRGRELARARTAVSAALRSDLDENEREEILLLDAKIDMREGEPGNLQLLDQAMGKFQDFIRVSRIPAFRSEAKGWVARVHYLKKDYPFAAKIYLDELSNEDSVFDRDSLVTSLRMLFPYNGSSSRLADHLEDYFDTPSHALFVVNLVTNPIYFDEEERASMAEVAKKTIDILKRRRDLFDTGGRSEALVLALMRAAIYMGDTRSALSYSQWIPETSETAGRPEFNWMRAACHFLQRDYSAAEAPLLRMHHAKEANFRDRSVAALGLVGVYQKLGRGVDQLHASFLYYKAQEELPSESLREGESAYSIGPYHDFVYLPASGWLVDLPYLLDVQLEDEELSLYLKQYSKPARLLTITSMSRPRSAYEIVEYALAVRYARQEKYLKSASIYKKLKASPRSNRMLSLARLHARANNTDASPGERLEAKYAYASFLEEHSTQVFFNDMLWHGFQRYFFLAEGNDVPCTDDGLPFGTDGQGLTRKERELLLDQERRLKDEQEERWRAYKILKAVIEKAGRSELGHRAAAKSLKCLKLINTERFGRKEEIDSAIKHLSN